MQFCIRFKTLCRQLNKKKRAKNDVLVRHFHFGKCLQNTYKNHIESNDFCMCSNLKQVVKTSLKNMQKNCVFVSNFHFGKCLINIGKNHFEINSICLRFETLCAGKFLKNVLKTMFLWVIVNFVNCVQNTCKKSF